MRMIKSFLELMYLLFVSMVMFVIFKLFGIFKKKIEINIGIDDTEANMSGEFYGVYSIVDSQDRRKIVCASSDMIALLLEQGAIKRAKFRKVANEVDLQQYSVLTHALEKN